MLEKPRPMKSTFPADSAIFETEKRLVRTDIAHALADDPLDKFGIAQKGPEVGFLRFPFLAETEKTLLGLQPGLFKLGVFPAGLGPDDKEPGTDHGNNDQQQEEKNS